MRIILIFLLFLVQPVFAMSGKVVKVVDGNNIIILEQAKKQVKIRLYGIDAPEKRQAYGQRATSALASMVAGKTVQIEEFGKDRYGRTLGLVKAGSVNVNENLVKNGFALVYESYCKKSFCREWKQREATAKSQGRGLWRGKNPIPPWKWR